MNSLVVYHSQFGNTKTLADIIGSVLKTHGSARVVDVNDFGRETLEGVDLLVVGGPTQAHGTSPAVKPFLETLADKAVPGTAAATFDTRLKGPAFLWGSAAKPTAEFLEHAGFRLVAPPESFVVTGMKEPHLEEGESARAKDWATAVARQVESQLPAVPAPTALSG